MRHDLAKKILFYLVLSLFITLPALAQDQTNINAGFVSGIWYSKDPFFAGEDVRIYTAIQNQSGFDITGKIQFFDNDEMISESSFSSISGQLIQEWTDWKVTGGDHEIYVKLSDTKKSEAGSEPEEIEIISPSSAVDKKFADIDTDGDGIGNMDDEDDDNDNLSDEKEKEIGTDPLNIDTDNDGHEDGFELKNGLDPLTHIKDETIQKQVKDEDLVEEDSKEDQEGLVKKIIINPATKAKEVTEEKADKFTKFIIAKLEKKKVDLKEKIQELKSEKNGDEDKGLSEEEEKSINRKITISQVYLSIVSTILEILKNKWLFAIVVIILILIFVKIFKRKKYE